MADVPPLPPGFRLDNEPAKVPPLPPGFTIDQQQAAQSQEAPVTGMERAGAVASGFNSGVAGLLGLPVDTMRNLIDLGKMAVAVSNPATNPFIGGEVPPMLQANEGVDFLGSQYFRNLLNKVPGKPADIPRPDDPASRYLFAAGQGASGAMLGPAVGAPVVPSMVSGVAGSESAQLAQESGYGPGVQALAGNIGAMAPSLIRAGFQESVRRGIRGGEEGRQRMAQNAQSFRMAGTSPSVGQASESRIVRATESLLSRTPGGAGRMTKAAEKQAAELGSMVEKISDTLAPKATGEQAGRVIQRGISGEGGFIEQFKAKQESLYNELDKHIHNDSRIDVSHTAQALKDLNQDIPGAPNISEFFKNAKIKGIEGALKADTEGASALIARTDIPEFVAKAAKAEKQFPSDPFRSEPNKNPFGPATKEDLDLAAELLNDGKLPYEAVKKLRTLVGREMADSGLASDVPRSKWKALYGALSQDLETAANNAGPAAKAAYSRANTYTRAGMRRIEVLDNVVDKAGGPESVFRAATSGTKEGATTLRAVMQSLPPESQKVLSASVLRRLGRATSGRQNDLGDKFSTETFLTSWNSMAPEAKAVLFDRYGPGFRQDMDAIARVTANLREGSSVFRNPSGTGQAIAQTSAAVAFLTSLASGNVPMAGSIAGGVGGANLSARILTNPNAVKWIASTTRAPRSALPALISQAARSNDKDLQDLAKLMQQAQSNEQNNQQRGSYGR